ncbi:hypothetical protein M8J75_003025 [Diaphorina citri]|nr:hypothetical protein M8J75_003025 [Diaphorina citri]
MSQRYHLRSRASQPPDPSVENHDENLSESSSSYETPPEDPDPDSSFELLESIANANINRRNLPRQPTRVFINTNRRRSIRTDFPPNIPSPSSSESDEDIPGNGSTQQSQARTNRKTTWKAGVRNEPRGRMKWTEEMNKDMIRSFYYVNKCNDRHLPGVRNLLRDHFVAKYPHLSHLSTQNCMDRKNLIMRKNYPFIPIIKGEIQRELEQENSLNEDIANSENFIDNQEQQSFQLQQSNNSLIIGIESIENDHIPELAHPNMESESLISQLLRDNLAKYEHMDPLSRPAIPSLKNKTIKREKIDEINTCIQPYLGDTIDLHKIHTILYSAAVTYIESENMKLIERTNNDNSARPRCKDPPWRKRLERNIKCLRSDHDIIAEYLKPTQSTRVERIMKIICRKANLNMDDRNQLVLHQDLLRQKVKVQSAKLVRYNKSYKRKTQNEQFCQDQQKFFNNLKTGTIENNENDVDHDKFLEFWTGMWRNDTEAKLDEPWIQDLEEKAANIPTFEVNITALLMTKILKKTSNWKAPDIVNITISLTKHKKDAYEGPWDARTN